jgi:hypothetical protein
MGESVGGPPILNVTVSDLRGGVKINKPKLIFNQNSNADEGSDT